MGVLISLVGYSAFKIMGNYAITGKKVSRKSKNIIIVDTVVCIAIILMYN